jgi:hypothetical protein
LQISHGSGRGQTSAPLRSCFRLRAPSRNALALPQS